MNVKIIKNRLFSLGILLLLLFACTPKESPPLEIIFLQTNDVYEILPLGGGDVGGIARVATLKKQLLAENPNTFLFLSGDFLSPSAIGAIKYEGQLIKGKHIVEVMNEAKYDFVTFGNHEFDITEQELQACIELSNFQWIATNTFHLRDSAAKPFVRNRDNYSFPKNKILEIKNTNGEIVKIGLLGITLPYTKPNFVTYDENVFEVARAQVNELKDKVDAIFAMTHLNVADDIKMAQNVPEIKLLMGGHDHDNMIQQIKDVTMAKADANAKTAYIHRIKIYSDKRVEIKSELKKIDTSIPFDETTQKVAKKWLKIANDENKNLNFEEVVLDLKGKSIDAKESTVRNKQCEIGKLILEATNEALDKKADVTLLGSGSIRIDDELKNNLTQYDILRILPFGAGIDLIEVDGNFLQKLLEDGEKNTGTGGYLQRLGAEKDEKSGKWKVNNSEIQANKRYKVALNTYLISGKETNLQYLNRENKQIKILIDSKNLPSEDIRTDIRRVLIAYLKKK